MIPSLRECLSPHFGNVNGSNPFNACETRSHSLTTDFFESVRSAIQDRSLPIEGPQPPKAVLEELDLDVLKDASGQTHLYSMSGGTPVGVTLAEKNYKLDDPYIENSPLRKNASALLKAPREKTLWCERAGVLHLGGQISSFLPVAAFPGGSVGPTFGVSADAILRYRSLQPKIDGHLMHMPLPLTPAYALEMPCGSEFEFLGAFAAGVSVGVFIAKGIVAGPAMLGAAFYTSAGMAGKVELGICVTALDKPGHVRITVRKLGRAESFYSMGVTGGLMYQLASNWTSAIGTNASALPNSPTTSAYINSITQTSVATLGGSIGTNYNKTTLFSVDLDLNNPKAHSIYRHMLSLQFAHAAEEAQANSDYARLAVAGEVSTASTAQAIFKMLGEVLAEDTQTHRHVTGNVELPSGDSICYVDSTVGEVQKFWIWGSRDVKWQEVTIEDKRTGTKTPYFRFRYTDEDRRYNENRLHTFLGFCKSIGLNQRELINGEDARLAAVKSRLNEASKVETNFDVFFSDQGIRTIVNTPREVIIRTYLTASTFISDDYSGTPLLADPSKAQAARDLLCIFEKESSSHRFDIFGLAPSINKCHKEYKKLTGRSITLDYGLLKQAENFANLIIRARDSETLEKGAEMLFIEVGRRKRFRYHQAIATLMNLAGSEDALIQKLSLESRHVKIAVPKMRELDHPQKRFADYVVSATVL